MKPAVKKFIAHRKWASTSALRRITSPRKMIAENLKSLRRNTKHLGRKAGRQAAFKHASKTRQF